jgi:predicted RNase H-like HicB family nuclease
MLVKFEVYQDGDFWCARGIGHDIFTQGKTVDALFENIKEGHFERHPHQG